MTPHEAADRSGQQSARGASAERVAQPAAPRRALWLACGILLASCAWALVIFAAQRPRFVVFAPTAKAGVEVMLALGSLFAALVLTLFPDEDARPRLQWVAAGFVVLGLGELVFGYLQPLLGQRPDLNASMYQALLVRSAAGVLFVIGLAPNHPPRLTARAAAGAATLLAALSAAVFAVWRHLPTLARGVDLELAARRDHATLSGLTPWHWAFSLLPLLLMVAATLGAARHYPGRALGGWLVIATSLLAAAQLHTAFWPGAFSPVFTTASVLRLALTAVVIAGAALELRHIAAERSELLTVEREYGRRLTELADLKADFTAMVAHELGSPIAAIRRSADILTLADLALPQTLAVRTIAGEADVLNALVADVQAIATLESEAFAVRPRPVALDQLFAAADAFASALPGAHPVHVSAPRNVRVLADPERIGQVLRNLLHNAARYAPDRTPIELRARLLDGRAHIEVADSGPGIHPADLTRIFNKFERGHGAQGRQPPGAGLGLYLSSRIVEAHGARLTARSTLGEGSVFAFTLEVAA